MNALRPMAIAVCIAFSSLSFSLADESTQDDSAEEDQPPSAIQLIHDVLIQLPQERLNITGDISVLKWGSGVQSKLKFETLLDLAAKPSFTQYTISDAFGRKLEQLTITRQTGEAPEFSYASGQPLVLRPTPNLSRTIRNTDITWLDLTLSFLWWTPEQEVGTDSVRSRDCYVIKVNRPTTGNTDATHKKTALRLRSGTSGSLSGAEMQGSLSEAEMPQGNKDNKNSIHNAARLWIDKKAHVLMQAEAINSENKAIRRLWVKSIKKVNGKWMIKNMEVAGSSADTRTRLTVRDVKLATDYDN